MMPVTTEELYTRDENLKREDVQIIQEWVKEQPHLPRLEEYQIIAFLHSSYYQTELAKSTIDRYFTIRTQHHELFCSLSKDILKTAMKYFFVKILPQKTPDGYTIVLFKLLDSSYSRFTFSYLVKITSMVAILHLYQQGFVKGLVVLFDARGFSLMHLAKIGLSKLKHSLDLLQAAIFRIIQIHVFNVGPAAEKLKTLVKPFLKTELYDTIELHSTVEDLCKKIPLECLPEDCGGKLPSVKVLQEENLRNFLENYKYCLWHDSQIVDESKRTKAEWSVFGWKF